MLTLFFSVSLSNADDHIIGAIISQSLDASVAIDSSADSRADKQKRRKMDSVWVRGRCLTKFGCSVLLCVFGWEGKRWSFDPTDGSVCVCQTVALPNTYRLCACIQSSAIQLIANVFFLRNSLCFSSTKFSVNTSIIRNGSSFITRKRGDQWNSLTRSASFE